MEYKGYLIKGDGKFGYYAIHHTGSGALPTYLTGVYTNPAMAKARIDSYQPKRGAKKKDVETNTTADV